MEKTEPQDEAKQGGKNHKTRSSNNNTKRNKADKFKNIYQN